MKENKKTCIDCCSLNCQFKNSKYPEYCPSIKLSEEERNKIYKIYQDEENRKVSRIAAEVEADFYCKYTRVEETVEFAKRMGFKKIGIATCVGLIRESRIFGKILRKNGFEVCSASCKIGSMKKTETVGLKKEKTKITGNIMCNPILQAEILNREKTDLNVVIGLCVGHDTLFNKYSKALTTTLITKDRVLGHNPVAALYQTKAYYSKLLK